MPGLGTSFGRGGATTAQQDLANADAILIMGSSMAENHPVGFRWVIKARERGATVIHVDPRFTRTSAMADMWVPLRAGSDIVFLGALINYVLEQRPRVPRLRRPVHERRHDHLREDFRDTEDLGGLFSGWDAETKQYPESWAYEGAAEHRDRHREAEARQAIAAATRRSRAATRSDAAASALRLSDPEAALRALHAGDGRRGLRRAAGCVPRSRRRVLPRVGAREDRRRSATRVGWTQHSTGVQIIRTAAILQLLLGNIGRPGGGILALRGHASIQGSTDIPTLYDILPGYLPMPTFDAERTRSTGYVAKHEPPTAAGGTTSTSTSSRC